MSSRLSIIVGGQFGSEGKGAVAAFLASERENLDRPVICVRVAGPNAGHTAMGGCPPGCSPLTSNGHVTQDGMVLHPWRLRQVPVAAVSNIDAVLVIAAGSEIDPEVLADEVQQLDSAGYDVSSRLLIDQAATVIEPGHKEAERSAELVRRIGSTGKGIGAARADRIMRTAQTVAQWRNRAATRAIVQDREDWLPGVPTIDTVRYLSHALVAGMIDDAPIGRGAWRTGWPHVVIEGTQGYGLGLHTENYPQTTSSDARAVDFLAMAGISPWLVDPKDLAVWVVLRCYPIRVAGNSGPLSGETSWEELGLPIERTTVTQNVRRVGAWDPQLARAAIVANGGLINTDDQGNNIGLPNPVRIALTMVDHAVPGVHGASVLDALDDNTVDTQRMVGTLIEQVESDTGAPVQLVGTGPGTIVDLRVIPAYTESYGLAEGSLDGLADPVRDEVQ